MLENFLGARKGADGPMGSTLWDDTWVGEVENQQDFGVKVLLSFFWVVLLIFFFRFCYNFLGTLKKKGHSSVTKTK